MEDIDRTKQRVTELQKIINHHNHCYYVLDSPEISDAEYDKLMNELIQLETEHPELVTPDSPTQRVGAAPAEAFGVVEHPQPLLSLANAFSYEDLTAWYRRISNLLGEHRFDLPAGGTLRGADKQLAVRLDDEGNGLAFGADNFWGRHLYDFPDRSTSHLFRREKVWERVLHLFTGNISPIKVRRTRLGKKYPMRMCIQIETMPFGISYQGDARLLCPFYRH